MASAINIVNNFTNDQVDTPQIAYTSPAGGNGTVITAFTAVNNSTSNKSYKAYIVPSGGVATNPIRPFRIVIWADEDLGSGVEGQAIPPGGTLQVEASAAGSIDFTVTGKES